MFELKNPYDEHPTVEGAINQIAHYGNDIPLAQAEALYADWPLAA